MLLVVFGGGEIARLRYVGFGLWGPRGGVRLAAGVPVQEARGIAEGASYVHTTRLVDSGLYAVVRHPQFVAWLITSIAVSLISQQVG